VIFPDGSETTKKTFDTNAEEAYAMVYRHEGKWYVSSVRAEPQSWPGQESILVRRVLKP
jgi:hypothetical protein